MYCVKCGQQLPDDAAFCMKCGAPQRGGVSAPAAGPPRWETCEIDLEEAEGSNFFNKRYQWVAQGMGPQGHFIAGKSEPFKRLLTDWNSTYGKTMRLRTIPSPGGYPNVPADREWDNSTLKRFVQKLASEGWDHDGQGEWWFNHQFRRSVW